MNILVLGSGGREHALTWKIAQSPKCERLFVAPGNAGTNEIAQNIHLSVGDFEGIYHCIIENHIDLVVVGPEDPLVQGIREFLMGKEDLHDLLIVGPGKEGAKLEGSKDYSKEFMQRNGIPTADYKTFNKETVEQGIEFLKTLSPPYVLKADGLAAGKGVIISEDLEEASAALTEMIVQSKFGDASKEVLVEEFLSGIEVSVFVLTDGKDYVLLPEAKDYKRIGEGDTGLNTGGMGAISPVPFADEVFMKKVKDTIINPTISGLNKEGIDYKGFIFFGLINVGGEPFVIEYNVRMGDPETQAVIPRIKSDLVDLLVATASGKLKSCEIEFSDEVASTVVMVAGGYPEAYEKGNEIAGLKKNQEALVFHAGTKLVEDKVVSNGGRVLAITGMGKDMNTALSKAYNTIDNISWKDVYCRFDIGKDLLNLK